MSLSAILGALGGVAGIVAAVYGIFKWAAWKLESTPEGTKEEVDEEIARKKKAVEDGGRPQ